MYQKWNGIHFTGDSTMNEWMNDLPEDNTCT